MFSGPNAPTNITIDQVQQNSFRISFPQPTGAQSYDITANNLTRTESSTFEPSFTYTFDGLEAGTVYNVTVTATGSDQSEVGRLVSAGSDVISVVTGFSSVFLLTFQNLKMITVLNYIILNIELNLLTIK